MLITNKVLPLLLLIGNNGIDKWSK